MTTEKSAANTSLTDAHMCYIYWRLSENSVMAIVGPVLRRNGTNVDGLLGRALYDRPCSNVQVLFYNRCILAYLLFLFTMTRAGCSAPSDPFLPLYSYRVLCTYTRSMYYNIMRMLYNIAGIIILLLGRCNHRMGEPSLRCSLTCMYTLYITVQPD